MLCCIKHNTDLNKKAKVITLLLNLQVQKSDTDYTGCQYYIVDNEQEKKCVQVSTMSRLLVY